MQQALPPGFNDWFQLGWEVRYSKSRDNQPYYYNNLTGSSQWEVPSLETVRVHHILIKHAGSRRPSSWRQEKITLTKEEALAEIKGKSNDIYSSFL